ncbi:hypothetical protein MLD38_000140 [Melastoma candidum]|uniref:Uncharacterized protein n=1 Tax=Melastoma candidum TaxID=119954 RepID=A0ACB9SB35_9MYRT|nr:hypothetical protein MLD38_000140 [Melastoma candidum]
MYSWFMGEEKFGYVDGSYPQPSETEPRSRQGWTAKNSMIMAWLISSMHQSIVNAFMFLHSAKEIWDSLRRPTQMPKILHKSST